MNKKLSQLHGNENTFRAERQHTERLPSDNHLLHDDTKAVHISWLGARFAQGRAAEQLRGSPEQILKETKQKKTPHASGTRSILFLEDSL